METRFGQKYIEKTLSEMGAKVVVAADNVAEVKALCDETARKLAELQIEISDLYEVLNDLLDEKNAEKGMSALTINATDYSSKDIVKLLREWTELTQEEFAHSIGKTKKIVQNYEQGITECDVETLLAIAKAHKITITIRK